MIRIPTPMIGFSRSRGFTLLEVLIALVILSIGLLGIAALQGVGLRSSHGAYVTSQASLLAYDMADRIRANATGFGAIDAVDVDGNPVTAGTLGTIAATCPSSPSSGLALVDQDIEDWACAVENLLPSGNGRITRLVDGGVVTFAIRIEWEDLQAEADEPWTYELTIVL